MPESSLQDALIKVRDEKNTMSGRHSPAPTISQRFRGFIKAIPILGPWAKRVWDRYKSRPFGNAALVRKLDALSESAVSCYLGNGIVLTRVKGFKMFLPSDDISITPSLLLENSHESWATTVFLRLIKPGMTVVDIGANIGYYTLLAAGAVGPKGKVYGFEPEPRNFELLRRNVMVNGLNWATLSDKALWNEAGTAQLFTTHGYAACGGHTLCGGDAHDTRPSIAVETITLDAFLSDDRKVDVIKIDAEGAEPFILEGMQEVIRSNRDLKIIMEFSPAFLRFVGRDPVNYLADLRKQGFRVRLIMHDTTLEELDPNSIEPDSDWLEMVLLDK